MRRETAGVSRGRAVVALEPGERFTIERIVLEGRRALLHPGRNESEFALGPPLRLAARAARSVTLDVVAAESGEPLDDVQVVERSDFGLGLSFDALDLFPSFAGSGLDAESVELMALHDSLVADGASPLRLELPEEQRGPFDSSKSTLRVTAPGRVPERLEVDWFTGGRARVELQRGGSLAFRLTGFDRLSEVARRLEIARPPATTAQNALLAGVSSPRPWDGAAENVDLFALLLPPLAPEERDPRELTIEREVIEELEWQASLSEVEIDAFDCDEPPPDEEQLRVQFERQHAWPMTTERLAARRVGAEGRGALHRLPPGRYRLRIVPPWNDSPFAAIGEVEATVVAGETTTVEVPLELPADGPFVPLVGTIRWPCGSALERFTLWWEPLDGDERRSRNLIGPLELPAVEHGSVGATALEAWREVRLGAVRPGRWRIHEPYLGLRCDVVVDDSDGAGASSRFELIVPELAEIDVRLIDAATGDPPTEPIRLRRALHPSIAGRLPTGYGQILFNGLPRLDSPTSLRLVTAAGTVPLEIESPFLSGDVELLDAVQWFEPGRHEVTLTVAPPTVIAVDWSDTEASAVEQRPAVESAEALFDRELERALRRARLVPLDRDEPPLFADWQRGRAGWFRLPRAGRYRLELVVPPGAAPLPPRVVEARAGEIVQVTVERPRRG
ncbi:MAG: hypothetical protein JNL90_20940 [Planctomycetes bacterium]|nr:hypothetical protein [Planctomycetota bacterium]